MGAIVLKTSLNGKTYLHIIQHYPIYVYVRPVHEEVSFYPNADITTLNAPLLEISSTLIRKNVKEGKSVRYLVPDKVLEEITRNGYYRN
jgi:nicotinate-nucleotide adenylyltransferase